MASTVDFIEYVYDQICGAGEISYKKMFGEYGIYCHGKFIALVADNQFFIKNCKGVEALIPDCPKAPPYEGASLYFLIEDLEDTELLNQLIQVAYAELPMQKPRVKKVKK